MKSPRRASSSRSSWSVSSCWRSGSPRTDELARAVPAISSSIRSAYGRMSSIRACARLSFDAATSSSARVILRVLRTERMRRRMSCSEATLGDEPRFLFDVEHLPELLQLLFELRRHVIGEIAGLADLLQDRSLRAQVLAQLVLEPR